MNTCAVADDGDSRLQRNPRSSDRRSLLSRSARRCAGTRRTPGPASTPSTGARSRRCCRRRSRTRPTTAAPSLTPSCREDVNVVAFSGNIWPNYGYNSVKTIDLLSRGCKKSFVRNSLHFKHLVGYKNQNSESLIFCRGL